MQFKKKDREEVLMPSICKSRAVLSDEEKASEVCFSL